MINFLSNEKYQGGYIRGLIFLQKNIFLKVIASLQSFDKTNNIVMVKLLNMKQTCYASKK